MSRFLVRPKARTIGLMTIPAAVIALGTPALALATPSNTNQNFTGCLVTAESFSSYTKGDLVRVAKGERPVHGD